MRGLTSSARPRRTRRRTAGAHRRRTARTLEVETTSRAAKDRIRLEGAGVEVELVVPAAAGQVRAFLAFDLVNTRPAGDVVAPEAAEQIVIPGVAVHDVVAVAPNSVSLSLPRGVGTAAACHHRSRQHLRNQSPDPAPGRSIASSLPTRQTYRILCRR